MGDHTEVFAIDFDPRVLTYDELLESFWRSHKPDRGSWGRQYLTAAFPSASQAERAHASRERVASRLGAAVETPVVEGARFYLAEDYHQKYKLRHEPVLLAELAGYTPRAFVDSTVAARLNSYAGGHGSLPMLEQELDAMALSRGAIEHLRARLAGRRR